MPKSGYGSSTKIFDSDVFHKKKKVWLSLIAKFFFCRLSPAKPSRWTIIRWVSEIATIRWLSEIGTKLLSSDFVLPAVIEEKKTWLL